MKVPREREIHNKLTPFTGNLLLSSSIHQYSNDDAQQHKMQFTSLQLCGPGAKLLDFHWRIQELLFTIGKKTPQYPIVSSGLDPQGGKKCTANQLVFWALFWHN